MEQDHIRNIRDNDVLERSLVMITNPLQDRVERILHMNQLVCLQTREMIPNLEFGNQVHSALIFPMQRGRVHRRSS